MNPRSDHGEQTTRWNPNAKNSVSGAFCPLSILQYVGHNMTYSFTFTYYIYDKLHASCQFSLTYSLEMKCLLWRSLLSHKASMQKLGECFEVPRSKQHPICMAGNSSMKFFSGSLSLRCRKKAFEVPDQLHQKIKILSRLLLYFAALCVWATWHLLEAGDFHATFTGKLRSEGFEAFQVTGQPKAKGGFRRWRRLRQVTTVYHPRRVNMQEVSREAQDKMIESCVMFCDPPCFQNPQWFLLDGQVQLFVVENVYD